MLRFISLFVAASLTGVTFGQDKPPLPFIDQGACPFECCTYREWKAGENVVAYVEPKENAAVAFKINKGQSVNAETGFVATTKVGVTKVLKPVKLGYERDSKAPDPVLNLKPGDLLYTLHYAGEGVDVFWYKGKVYSDEIFQDKPDPDPPAPDATVQVISRPVYGWWVKVKNKNGEIGWIRNPSHFDNADACS